MVVGSNPTVLVGTFLQVAESALAAKNDGLVTTDKLWLKSGLVDDG